MARKAHFNRATANAGKPQTVPTVHADCSKNLEVVADEDNSALIAEQNNENRNNKKRKKTEGPSLLQTSPSARALSFVSAYLASLQNPLPILGRQQYLKFAKLNKQRDDLIRRQAKLDPSTDYFPNSMNFNFTLQAPESLKGTT